MDLPNQPGPTKASTDVKSVVDTLRQLKQADALASAQQRASRLTAADNTSAPFHLSRAAMRERVLQLREHAALAGDAHVAQADAFWLGAVLNARKGDVARAYALASNYLAWRRGVGYDAAPPAAAAAVRDILHAGLFVLAGNVSAHGRPVLTVRYRFFNPRRWAALDTARAFGFVVEWMLRTYPRAQTHGIVVVEDAAGFSFANFDVRLIGFLEKAFSSILPVRMAALHVVNPGWVVRGLYGLFAAFFSDKLKARIRLFGRNEQDRFLAFFERDQILAFLNMGGTMQWTPAQQEQMANRLLADALRWPEVSTFEKPQ